MMVAPEREVPGMRAAHWAKPTLKASSGLMLGVIEALGMHFTNPSLKALLSYVVFIGVLLFRPRGLFAK